MARALKGIGTAIVIGGLIVATGGAAIAMSAGVGLGGALGLAGGATLSVGGFSVTASGLIGAGSLISSAASAYAARKAPASSGYSTEWMADSDQPIPFAFGKIGVSGLIHHKDEYGGHEAYYSVLSVISGAGPIKSFGTFRGDQKVVAFGGSSGMASSSEWANYMWRGTRLGTQPDTALLSPSGIDGTLPQWGSAYKTSGKAVYMLTMAHDSKLTKYPDGEPQVLQEAEGLFYWDPRLDSTYPGGSGACRLNDPSTWPWGENGALFALKWALGLWEDPVGKGAPGVGTCVGGIGSSPDGVDIAAFVYAANVADANGWKCAAWPNTKEDKNQVMDWLLQSAGAVRSRRAGLISCISRGAPQPSIVTVTAADTAGPIELDSAMPRLDRFNEITPRYWSPAHFWEMVPSGAVKVAEYVTQDGGRRPRGVDYPYVTNSTQVGQLAAYDIVDSREGISGTIPFKTHMRRIKPGDCFTLDEPGFVLDGQKVKAWGRSIDPQTGIVRIRFRSETDSKHAFAMGQTSVPPPDPALTVLDPTLVPAPGALEWALTSEVFVKGGVPVPTLLITGAAANTMADAVIVEYRVVGAADWTPAGLKPSATSRVEITGLTNLTAYEVAVSYRVRGVLGARRVLGPVTSGSALPISSVIGAGVTLNPAVPLSPGSPPDTAIAVAATTATLLGGEVISLPSATISGLAANTTYAVFRDLQDGVYIAASSSLTAYFSSLGRYLPMGYQTTAIDSGGGYSPPPPPPPGGGGGYCPDEDTPILLADGTTRRAGDLKVGDYVRTMHEGSLIWTVAAVYAVESVAAERVTLTAGGRTLTATEGHRVHVQGRGFVAIEALAVGDVLSGDLARPVEGVAAAGPGVVVRISVQGAQTYVANGILSHNLKPKPTWDILT